MVNKRSLVLHGQWCYEQIWPHTCVENKYVIYKKNSKTKQQNISIFLLGYQ